ncbi:glycosyltransferase family 4 protein [Luedemannella flava]|uniref:Glycosyltransferase family 4 protein n=1 Tax=Luedemannella flava TaxID=349316 RepID=A0ABN2LG46_9ACTN
MVVPPWYEMPPTGYGGLEMIASALVDGLVERGHDVTLFGAGERTGTKATFVSTTPTLQYARLGETLPDVLHVARVHRLIAAGDFDIVHDHTAPGPLTAGRLTTPTVLTVHGGVDGELGDYYEAVGDTIRLIAISHSQRRKRTTLPWIATVHNGLTVPDDAEGRPGGTDGPVVWLARFNPDKGPDLAINACRTAGLPLVLAGKCNEALEERYFNNVITPMLDDSVEVLVNADRPTIQARLRAARCMIMPIRWEEPFGMVMIEAMVEGVPVVALRRGAVPEIIRDGVTGFICDSVDELPDALHAARELDPAACVRHVRESFSSVVMAERYERAYYSAIEAHFTLLPPPHAARAKTELPASARGVGAAALSGTNRPAAGGGTVLGRAATGTTTTPVIGPTNAPQLGALSHRKPNKGPVH